MDVVVIRADASPSMGSGHIRRMSILAEEFRENGCATVLLCKAPTLRVCTWLRDVFDDVHVIENEPHGVSVLTKFYGNRVNLVFFDHYELDFSSHSCYRRVAPTLAAIDDLASRNLDVDILFDINLGRSPGIYKKLVPGHTEIYVGPQFQLFHPDFRSLRPASFVKRKNFLGKIKRIFISMGGTDPSGFVLEALNDVLNVFPSCNVDVATGRLTPHLKQLHETSENSQGRVNIHVDSKTVPELMFRADLGIGAGGTMTWERNCLGLPTVLLVMADNQEQVGAAMKHANAALVCDAQISYPREQIVETLRRLANATDLLKQISMNSFAIGGANGAAEIYKVLCGNN